MRKEGEFIMVRNGEPVAASFVVEFDGDHWSVEVGQESDHWRAEAEDAFAALSALREQLEPNGVRFGLNGALVNVWPSGMAREMGGTRAYVHDPEKVSRREPLEMVDVFEPADVARAVTIADQRAWLIDVGVLG